MKKLTILLLLLAMTLATTGCVRQYDSPEYIDISPNETAFLVPLETSTLDGQAQVRSLDFLEQAKVQSKRVRIPHRWSQLGRMPNDGEWIDTMQVIKVDRSPVSRVWTAEKSSGTSRGNEAIWVETADSIEFAMAISMTARVKEEDTAKFLYQFAGRRLSSVMDTDLRSAIMNKMNSEFGTVTLSQATKSKVVLIEEMSKYITKTAKDWGIDVTTVGSAGGMVYKDSTIQKQINDAYTAEKAVVIAEQKKLQQAEVNLMNVSVAKAEAEAAKEWAKASAEYEKKIVLDVMRMEGEAKLKWNGKYPTDLMVLPEGSNLLLTPGGN